MRPLIGITTYGRIERPSPSEHYAEFYSVPAQYVNAVRRAGGIAVMLPPGEILDGWLDRLEGLLVTGGTDVDPLRYDSSRTAAVQAADAERDESELALTRAVIAADMPTLFVCRGMQVLNVATGGSLHHHIPDLGIGDIHRGDDGGWTDHPVEAVSGSRVAEAMGTAAVETRSGHHQAIDRLGEGLVVSAVAPDGLAEALEVATSTWMVGVQWHPEVTAATDLSQQRLFDRLVELATV